MVVCSVCNADFDNKLSYQQHYDAKHKKRALVAAAPKKSRKRLYILAAVLILGLAAYFMLSGGGEKEVVENFADTSNFKGNESAPITIIEFADFQCPFCGRFFKETLPLIEENYVDKGFVKIQYKHFPLDQLHSQATPAALASECAREQGKFWAYHDILFANQNSLRNSAYKQWAVALELNAGQFNQCFDSKKYASKVSSDSREGARAGVTGTPAFLVNGQFVNGAQPFSVFQSIIEAELAK